jgi:hypothetical protein
MIFQLDPAGYERAGAVLRGHEQHLSVQAIQAQDVRDNLPSDYPVHFGRYKATT